jgi:FtsH-binding integral membrane protein
MRKIYWFAAAALILTGIGGWAASTTHARVDIPTAGDRVSPVELITTAKDLRVEEFEDYSFVFN